ncbi:MAG: FAD-binding oxidoreductase [Nitrosopumilus sp.]|uniref:FAD-binding oxidoreductase n=1 Tax=Nitrosopumilus sp. TaxID=2024843 RepID=UPI00247BDE6E|nr:FAD-binding oxidoreductase [Nitrosopumilus sp.]MCV0392093.1 FAD-binding oxidoreductase [Nitrosopumilus sp.]
MKKTILKALQSSIKGQVQDGKEFRRFYSVDASSYQIIPKIIVIAKNENDVVNTVKIAKKFKISVTVRGAGTGLVGSALNDGIILDLKNLDSHSVLKNHIKVGPGVIKGKLDIILNQKKMFFPPNPSIGSFCSVGGMLGNNSSGSRSLKYGSVIDNVSEIKFVNGNGKTITLPKNKKISNQILNQIKRTELKKFPKVSKNSSGYRLDKIKTINDTHKIIIGSEGTLGIIISATLKIKPLPKKRILFIIEYDSVNNAAENCIEINKTNPSAIEFVDKPTLNQINFKFNKKTKCLLFVEYDENIKNNERKLKTINTGKIVQTLLKKSEIQKWWKYRDSSLYYSLKTIKKENRIPHVIEDAAVPLEKLPRLFSILNKINKKYHTKSIAYGHAGNGNIHVRLISDRKKIGMIKKIAKEYFHEILKNGGTITAEHGDGLARSEFVREQYGDANYKIFKDLKRFFDPDNLLNPGKKISKKSTIVNNLENYTTN